MEIWNSFKEVKDFLEVNEYPIYFINSRNNVVTFRVDNDPAMYIFLYRIPDEDITDDCEFVIEIIDMTLDIICITKPELYELIQMLFDHCGIDSMSHPEVFTTLGLTPSFV